jgi:uncharacterized protein (TIGR03437 family)
MKNFYRIGIALIIPLAAFGDAPAVTAVVNGSSTIPGGLPNSGIAPSSLFQIQGSGMATPGTVPVLQDSTQGLPLTLNGTSVSVTVNGVTVTPALYYSSPTLVAGVLPAATPPGTGTITVSYNGTPSASSPIQVVPSAYGFTTYSGLGVATDALTGALITYTNSAKPGEILVFWGTGLGSDPADSDTTYSSSPHAINTPVQMYIGGVQVPASSIAYSGASVYPGVDVIGVTVPQGALNGCYSPVAIVTGSGADAVVSNVVTLPIDANGGSCTDQHSSLTGSQISAYNAQTSVTVGDLNIGVSTLNGTTTGIVLATFYNIAGPDFLDSAATGIVTVGGCTTLEVAPGEANAVSANETALNAGNVSFQGPSGNIALTQAGYYYADLTASQVPAPGQSVSFTATGAPPLIQGPGAFTMSLTFLTPALNWTNQSAVGTITRSQGLQVTWTGGAPGSFIFISGSASVKSATASFECYAPVSAGQFTIPSYILMTLPAGTGSIALQDQVFQPISLPGIQYSNGVAYLTLSASTKYQ